MFYENVIGYGVYEVILDFYDGSPITIGIIATTTSIHIPKVNNHVMLVGRIICL